MGKLILVMLQQTFVERQGRRRRIEGGAIFFYNAVTLNRLPIIALFEIFSK